MNENLEQYAKTCLNRLLDLGERGQAGLRRRPAALTSTDLTNYRSTSSLEEKIAFESVIEAASLIGAISIEWDRGYAPRGSRSEGFISRVSLLDLDHLASFLDRTLVGATIDQARSEIAAISERYPVVLATLSRWAGLKSVRGLRPQDAHQLCEAARVIDYCERLKHASEDAKPIREASAELFNDSKRIEKLATALDILLSGDIGLSSRPAEDVWKELGLYREEQPVRLAGMTIVVRDRLTSVIDRPYIGLHAGTIVGLGSTPKYVMSIENQTTFHSEARRLCDDDVLLIYTGGMPSPSWRSAYLRMINSVHNDVPIFHWGDVDEGGFRIASLIARDLKGIGRELKAWRMHPADVPTDRRRQATHATASKMREYAIEAGWLALGQALYEASITVEQESLTDPAQPTW